VSSRLTGIFVKGAMIVLKATLRSCWVSHHALAIFGRDWELGGWNRSNEHQSKHALRVDSSDILRKFAAHAKTDKNEPSCSLRIGNREHILRLTSSGPEAYVLHHAGDAVVACYRPRCPPQLCRLLLLGCDRCSTCPAKPALFFPDEIDAIA